jgi:lambda family phage tail tape measure protein
VANETTVVLSADASGYRAELDSAAKSASTFAQSQAQAAARVATSQAAIAEAAANGSKASASSINSFISSLTRAADTAGKTRSELLELKAAQLGVSEAAAASIASLRTLEQGAGESGEAMEGLGLKSAGARREILVMLHEASQGNWKNLAGSVQVFGEKIDLMGKIMSPAGIAIGAVAGAAIGFVAAIVQGQNQIAAYNKAMQATGGYAGVTSSQLADMATSMSSLGVPITKANALLIDVAATGKISGSAIQSVAMASSLLADATGGDADKIVQKFAEMSGDIADGAAKMSEQYHFLTTAQYDEIKALQDSGDSQGAMKLAADDLTGSLEAQKIPLGTLPTLLHEGALAWASFWQAAMNVGKPDTPRDTLNALRQELVDQQKALASGSSSALNYQIGSGPSLPTNSASNYQTGAPDAKAAALKYIADLKQSIADASREADLHDTSAQIRGWFAEQESDALKAAQAVDKLANSLDKNYEKQKSLKDLQQQFNKLYDDPSDPTHSNSRLKGVTRSSDGSFSGGEYDAIVKGINDKDKQKAPSTAIDTAALQQQVDAVKQALNQINTAYTNSQTLLDTAHKAGAISDTDYYTQQRALIAKTESDQETQLNKQETILKQHQASGAEQIRINKQIQDTESQLAKVRADAATMTQKSIQTEDAAMVQRMETVVKYNAALQDQLETQQNAADIQVASVGQGSVESQQAQQLNSLQRQYDKQRTTLLGQRSQATTPDEKAVYDNELDALQLASDKALKITQDGFDRMKAAQGNWQNGATQAYQNLADQSSNIAGQVSSAFTDAFNGMSDAFVSFVTTGKLSFTSLATSVVSDIARMAAKAAESQLFGAAFNALGLSTGISTGTSAAATSFAGAFHLADGGAVSGPGSSTSDSIHAMLSDGEGVLNARAMKKIGVPALNAINSGASGMLRFASGGYVGTAASSSGGGTMGGISINAPVTVQGGTDPAANQSGAAQLQKLIKNSIQATLQDERKQGGVLWKIANGRS